MNKMIIKICLLFLITCLSLFLVILAKDIINWKIDSNNIKKEIRDIYKNIEVNEIKDKDSTIIVNQDSNTPKSNPY